MFYIVVEHPMGTVSVLLDGRLIDTLPCEQVEELHVAVGGGLEIQHGLFTVKEIEANGDIIVEE